MSLGNPVRDTMHRLIIGDIHGCWDELQELLDRAGLSDGDEVISLGDFVDRGLGTPQVLAFFRDGPGRLAVQGNHERKHWRSFRGETDAALSQRITRWQLGDEGYPAVCDWLERLPTWIDLPEALCVHGMFEPGLPVNQQRVTVIVGTMSGDAHLLRTYDSPWYELYDGDKPILVGHHNINGGTEPYVRRPGALTGRWGPTSRSRTPAASAASSASRRGWRSRRTRRSTGWSGWPSCASSPRRPAVWRRPSSRGPWQSTSGCRHGWPQTGLTPRPGRAGCATTS
ncbi:MAG: metallophosphoesterase [Armatimonadetes bacterium]|nr:metallophosphoesterase [Armatimonadota bacterium]